jgi:hypothetical protein
MLECKSMNRPLETKEKIFLNQGNYTVEIRKRFDMLECKSMNTPLETKLKLLVDTSSELVDATMYRQIIGSLMYLMNTRSDICFVVNNFESVSGRAQTCSPCSCKTSDEIPQGYVEIWSFL